MTILPNDRSFFSDTFRNLDLHDIQVYYIRDEHDCRIGFATVYPENRHIDKTEIIACQENYDAGYQPFPGKITVFMRSGDTYTFPCWADSVYCGQFGIRVSDDGGRVYVISRKKGLWCYTVQGELLWKTRLTTAGHIIPHLDNSLTCVTSTKLILLDAHGAVLKTRRIAPYRVSRLSATLISALITENTLAVIDSTDLEILQRISLSRLGIYTYSASAISETLIAVTGSVVVGTEKFDGDKERPVTGYALFLLDRATSQVLRRCLLAEYGMGFCPYITIHGAEVTLNGFAAGTETRMTVKFTV